MGDTVNELENLITHLNGIRERHGEDAWRRACTDVARTLLSQGGKSETFARGAFKDIVDFDSLDRELEAMRAQGAPEGAASQNAMMQALASQVPHLRTQAQFNAIMVMFDSVRVLADAIFALDKPREAEARQAFDKAVEVAQKVTEISEQLREVPEAATSAAADEFKSPPKQFGEYDTHKALMGELAKITSLSDLQDWYGRSRDKMDRVVSQTLRNTLFDAIRVRKEQLRGQPS